MPIESQAVLFSHIEEILPGVTPPTPAMELWRFNSETLTADPNTVDDPELSATGRSQKPSDVVGSTVTGDIELTLVKHNAFDQAMAGILANDFGSGPLTPGSAGGVVDAATRNTVGRTKKTFTIEKRWPNTSNIPGLMDIVATPDAAPGATLDITYTGTTTVGTGVVVIDVKTDLDAKSVRYRVPISVGDTPTDVGDSTVTAITGATFLSAVNAAGVVTLTPQGGATTIQSLSAAAGADTYVYQRFLGCTYSALQLSTTPNANIDATVSVVAGEPKFEYLPITGVTYTDPGEKPKLKSPGVIELTVGNLPGVLTSCWTSLNISLDSQNREIACIGSEGSRESALGSFLTTLSGDVLFEGDQSVIEAVFNGQTIGNSVVIFTSPDNDVYRLDITDVVVLSPGGVPATGQNEDTILSVEVQPTPKLVQDTGTEVWKEGVVVSTVPTAPTFP